MKPPGLCLINVSRPFACLEYKSMLCLSRNRDNTLLIFSSGGLVCSPAGTKQDMILLIYSILFYSILFYIYRYISILVIDIRSMEIGTDNSGYKSNWNKRIEEWEGASYINDWLRWEVLLRELKIVSLKGGLTVGVPITRILELLP